ncbi:hypothetical protein EV424DRAFT_1369209 [Suillus variegatus]|nr:hypothetical protein EV424DRAFT_1425340 [Suillus variegatus]KAG1832544.1 hypothetical protein EV424DRAFT_1369209 [Suillus variegatus]
MTPHIHIPSCKSTAGKANTHTSTHTNAEKALDVFTGSYDTVRVRPDIQIHPADIARFVQVGFDDQINSFATRSCFQPTVIQDIMHIAAMESAKVEIQQLRDQRLREDSDSEDLYERPEKKETEPKEEDSDSEDLYERPKKAKAETEPKEEEND